MRLPTAVLFDLDDTLFAHRGAVARGIRSHLEAVGIAASDPELVVADWTRLEEHHYHRYLAGELGYEGQRRARAREFAASHGVELTDDEAGEWFTAYFEHYRAAWELHDDALACLDALRAERGDIRFGLITNGDLAFQERKVAQVGLDRVIDLLVASGEVGIVKPDPRIFHHACDQLGVEPGDAAYVGDRLGTDAIGAAEAGLTGVWLNRVGAVPDEVEADRAAALGVVVIAGLDELPAALAG